ncbi:hypothetical protein BLNAU_8053 [Blattamonas nauphoetae]|uniref:Uncharacterized protein n=1 Tax=Blattamonas nauphoetae TaxID=2049346 RepID=A0ABQ9XZU2_9EUKA|nr:hypothetical protein BLNAU_8053 [Blattamonas nauphoetae]
MKSQPALDDSLEAQAVKFLKCVRFQNDTSAEAFLGRLATFSGDSSTHFVQSIVVLISSGSQTIIMAAMKMVSSLVMKCSPHILLALVKADLIHQIIESLNPLFLSFPEAVNIHTCLVRSISRSVWLTTPYYLAVLRIEDGNEQQAVRETGMNLPERE